jgi:hypothetical protein
MMQSVAPPYDLATMLYAASKQGIALWDQAGHLRQAATQDAPSIQSSAPCHQAGRLGQAVAPPHEAAPMLKAASMQSFAPCNHAGHLQKAHGEPLHDASPMQEAAWM